MNEEGRAEVTIPLAGRKPGETWDLNQTVDLGGFKVTLKSASLGGGEVGQDAGWLYVDVDLGPAVNGRLLSAFSLEGPASHMASMGGRDNAQFDRFGLELQPGQREAKIVLNNPMVNVAGPWVLTFAAPGK